LSYAEERFWFDQLDPEDPAYNIAAAVRLDGEIAAPALRAALERIAQRHEICAPATGVSRTPVSRSPRASRSNLVIDLSDVPKVSVTRPSAGSRVKTGNDPST
jgi:hypothetical protein